MQVSSHANQPPRNCTKQATSDGAAPMDTTDSARSQEERRIDPELDHNLPRTRFVSIFVKMLMICCIIGNVYSLTNGSLRGQIFVPGWPRQRKVPFACGTFARGPPRRSQGLPVGSEGGSPGVSLGLPGTPWGAPRRSPDLPGSSLGLSRLPWGPGLRGQPFRARNLDPEPQTLNPK